jgi:hypothetical protein
MVGYLKQRLSWPKKKKGNEKHTPKGDFETGKAFCDAE